MQRDEVRFFQKLVQLFRLVRIHGDRPRAVNGQERVVADDVHTDGRRRVCNHDTDRAETDHAERLSLDLAAHKLALALFHKRGNALLSFQRFCPVVCLGQIARGGDHRADHELFHAVCVRARRIEHDDALFGAFIDRDIVGARAGPRNGDRVFRKIHFMAACAAHDERVAVVLQMGRHVIVFLRQVIVDYRGYFIQLFDRMHSKTPYAFP